jgi:anti-sigma regulatory factor (Ser/Thr protein kinase)
VSLLGTELRLPNEPFSAVRARRFVREVLAEWDLPDGADDAELATSELVGNVVRHAGTDLVLRIEVDDYLKISVLDCQPHLGPVHPLEPVNMNEHGRGLRIVAAVALDCGVDIGAEYKAVWLTLPVRTPVSV